MKRAMALTTNRSPRAKRPFPVLNLSIDRMPPHSFIPLTVSIMTAHDAFVSLGIDQQYLSQRLRVVPWCFGSCFMWSLSLPTYVACAAMIVDNCGGA
jgi:hypothetical protein